MMLLFCVKLEKEPQIFLTAAVILIYVRWELYTINYLQIYT